MPKTVKIPFLSIVAMLGALIVGVYVVYAFVTWQYVGKLSEKAEKTAKKMRQAIREEIKSLKDHPWAGEPRPSLRSGTCHPCATWTAILARSATGHREEELVG
jgi:hypothetical protein